MKTTFKGVVYDTVQYRKVMNMVGRCLRKGGSVDFNHYTKPRSRYADHLYYGTVEQVVDHVDVTLDWDGSVNT